MTTASLLLAGFLFGIRYGDAMIQRLPGVVQCVEAAARFVGDVIA